MIRSNLQRPTALTLQRGDVIFRGTTRVLFVPGSVEESGTGLFYDGGFSWGITDTTQLTLAFQHVDSGSGILNNIADFNIARTDDNEAVLELKQNFWRNENVSVSGLIGLSFLPTGFGFNFNPTDGGSQIQDTEEDFTVVPALSIPVTISNERGQATFGPTVAFFQQDSTGVLPTVPGEGGSYGTTFGLSSSLSYNVAPRLTLFGDAFFPLTGNNALSRSEAEPAKAIVYNAGLRYLVNPRVALDVFATNALGSFGPTSLQGDRDFTSLATTISFLPEVFSENRRYRDSFDAAPATDRYTIDGLGFFDGGTVPSGRSLFQIQGGTQGVMTSFRYGFTRDLEAGVYLDYITSDIDESEQGVSGKIRLLNQAQGSPLTASLAATVGLPNEPFVNFFNNDRDSFDDNDLDRSVPFLFQGDNLAKGQLFIVTVSLPLTYQFDDSNAALWLTPTIGYVQRSGTELAGFNVGGSLPIVDSLSILGEVGANFTEPGNALLSDNRGNVIPWTIALRWDPSGFFGTDVEVDSSTRPYIELYVTNRVGSSAWHQLRVRDKADPAFGLGLLLPF
ncbi:MAG: hypothetical protein AAGG02_02625 [Cyanobacteria bacterium P01_H01_bin.15]